MLESWNSENIDEIKIADQINVFLMALSIL